MTRKNWIEQVESRRQQERAIVENPDYGDVWDFEQHLVDKLMEAEQRIAEQEQYIFAAMMENQRFLLALSESRGVDEAVKFIRQRVLQWREKIQKEMDGESA